MATFKSLTFGKISGKYGDALATQSKATGKNYLRAASEPSNPRTDKQVAHRAKFAFINSSLRPFYSVYKQNFGGNTGIRYGINIGFKNAIVGEYPDFSLDLSKLVFIEGPIYQVHSVSAVKGLGGSIKVDWDKTILKDHDPNALAYFVFFNEQSNQVFTFESDVKHAVGTVEIEMPTIWAGATIHSWIYFVSDDGLRSSTSQYINSLEL